MLAVKVVTYVGETNRHLAMRILEHLKYDKSSHVYKHLDQSSQCKSLCSEGCFSILNSADTKYKLKVKEALHISWLKPDLNKQVKHYRLTPHFLPPLLRVVSSLIFYVLLHIFLIIFNLFMTMWYSANTHLTFN